MSAAKKIHDDLDKSWSFGLWNECPEDAPVAWGARAIADQGCGFSLLPDRQTWAGPKELRAAFKKALDGALPRAIEEAKRLRDGWYPYKDLSEAQLRDYWYRRKREEPELFASWGAIGSGFSAPEAYGVPENPVDTDPRWLYGALERETKRQEAYDKEWERKQLEGEEDPPPDPPSYCENEYDEDEEEGEDCDQEFKKVRGKWEGCYMDFDAWVCDSCGHHHYIEDLEDEEDKPPSTPIREAFSKIVGYQTWRMEDREAKTFTLFSDAFVTIKGNTNSSYGYIYLIAYPTHHAVDPEAVLPRSAHPGHENGNGKTLAKPEDVYWSGPTPVPMPGDRVKITRPEIGMATVIAHYVEHNWLHLITVADGKLPEFWYNQRGDRFFPPAETWNVTGNEIDPEAIERMENGD